MSFRTPWIALLLLLSALLLVACDPSDGDEVDQEQPTAAAVHRRALNTSDTRLQKWQALYSQLLLMGSPPEDARRHPLLQ